MAIALHNLPKGLNKKRKVVGRGNSSGHGSYSTRGIKGQKARSGVSGLKLKGMKHIILSTPKLRGFNSMHGKFETVTLEQIGKFYKDGDTVNPRTLHEKGLVENKKSRVKILVAGELDKKVTVEGCALSKGAVSAIEAKGGQVKQAE